MRIGIDLRALATGRVSGVETYTVEFLTALFAQCPDDTFVLFFNAYHDTGTDFSWATAYPNVRIRRTRIPNKLLNAALWYLRWPKLDRLLGGVDVFFMPNINFCAVSRRTRLIVTVHDLSFVHVPETFSWKRRLWHLFVNPRRLVRRADRVIAVSAATRDDVVRTYGVAPAKVHVVHNAIVPETFAVSRNDLRTVALKERYRLPYRFVLFFGAMEPRKNIVGLIRAYEAFRARAGERGADVALVLAGSAGWRSRAIRDAIAASPYARDIRVLGFVPQEDKGVLYALASVFVYPSFFEGFGIPVLEAFACGTPTITSNTTALPEVAGDGALLIDPDRPEEICFALEAVLHDRDFARTLAARGRERVEAFSWERAAERFCAILHDMVAS